MLAAFLETLVVFLVGIFFMLEGMVKLFDKENGNVAGKRFPTMAKGLKAVRKQRYSLALEGTHIPIRGGGVAFARSVAARNAV